MRTKNVQPRIDLSDVWAIGSQFVRRSDQYLQPGDILVSSANSWNLVGKCCWVPELGSPSTFGGFISVLRADRGMIDPRYLYHWFASKPTQAKVRSFGRQTTNISNLDFSRCRDMAVPLPPMEIQRRIAEALDQVDALRVKRQDAIALLDDLTRSIFFDMFGTADRNRGGFEVQQLGDLVRLKSGSFLPASSMSQTGQYPVYGGNGITGWHGEFNSPGRQVVIGRVGAYCGCIHSAAAKSWITDNALYVSETSEKLAFTYLLHALKLADLNQYASQSAQPLISGSRIYPVRIIVPPVALQEEFEGRVSQIAGLAQQHERHRLGLDVLYASLEHQAFRGELFGGDSPAVLTSR